jgi:regulator of protease activity HflC (stomatin/prohibitin superfamily)
MVCDTRPGPFQIEGQESLTADGLAVRVSVNGEFRIVDPAAFVTASGDSFRAFYLDTRQALRTAISETGSEKFLSGQAMLTDRLKELLVPRAAHPGLEMTQVETWEAAPLGWPRQS